MAQYETLEGGGTGAHGSVSPTVSVIMPAHNAAKWVGRAVESIVRQTLQEWELIVVDDGSTDDTQRILGDLAQKDRRIRVITQPKSGVIRSLNRAVSLAVGEFVARMDADDESRPERLARQLSFLRANPACGIVGTWSSIYVDDRVTERGHSHPTTNGRAKWALLFDSVFVHSSVMIRRAVFEDCGVYPASFPTPSPEDFDLWSRVARRWNIANLPDRLLIYRETSNSVCRTADWNEFSAIANEISAENLAVWGGRATGDPTCKYVASLARGDRRLLTVDKSLREALLLLIQVWIKMAGSEGFERGLAVDGLATIMTVVGRHIRSRWETE